MIHEQIKQVLFDESPVIYNGITYPCVTAIIYRKDRGGSDVRVQLELSDQCGNSVTIAAAEKVKKERKHNDPIK